MSRISHRACAGFFFFPLNQPEFGWRSLQRWFRLIQIGRPLGLPSVFIWQSHFIRRRSPATLRLSMNVLVQSTSVTAREFSNMSSDACCARRCQGGYLCCRIGHRSPPLCLCLSLLHLSLSRITLHSPLPLPHTSPALLLFLYSSALARWSNLLVLCFALLCLTQSSARR